MLRVVCISEHIYDTKQTRLLLTLLFKCTQYIKRVVIRRIFITINNTCQVVLWCCFSDLSPGGRVNQK